MLPINYSKQTYSVPYVEIITVQPVSVFLAQSNLPPEEEDVLPPEEVDIF